MAFGAASQIWSRRARDFIAFSIVVSLVAGVIALVAGAIVSRCAVVHHQRLRTLPNMSLVLTAPK